MNFVTSNGSCLFAEHVYHQYNFFLIPSPNHKGLLKAFQQSMLLEASPRIATEEAVLKVFSRRLLISNWTDNYKSLKIQLFL